jgi:hypothetical protein
MLHLPSIPVWPRLREAMADIAGYIQYILLHSKAHYLHERFNRQCKNPYMAENLPYLINII